MNYRHRIRTSFKNGPAILKRDSTDGDQRLLGQRASLSDTFEAYHGVGIALRERSEDRSDGEIVGDGVIAFPHLFRVVCRKAYDPVPSDDSPGQIRRNVILSDMDAICCCRQRQIGAIIEDQRDPRGQHPAELAREPQNLPGGGLLLTQLNQCCAARYEFFGKFTDLSDPACPDSRGHQDGIEARRNEPWLVDVSHVGERK